MSDNKQKISLEKLKQLEELQKMMIKQQKNGTNKNIPGSLPPGLQGKVNKPSIFTPKGFFISILQSMQSSVRFIDGFINLITNKSSDNTNDVVKSAKSPIMFGFFVTIFFVFFGIIWASTAPLDSATSAIGTVISNSKKKSINHPEGGIIKNIFVQAGDAVKKGDQLLEFNDSRIRAQYESTLSQYRSLAATESRLLSEINNDEEIDFPEIVTNNKDISYIAKIIETQNNLFRSQKELIGSQELSLKQKTKQTHAQIEGLNARNIAISKTIEITKERYESIKKLNKQGFANRHSLLELEDRVAKAESELAINATEIARSEQEIIKNEIDVINIKSDYSQKSLRELKETQMKLSEIKESFIALSDSLSRVIIRAPADGIVNNINYHTIDSSIPPQQIILEISPIDDKLIIEAKIAPKNIDSIRVGLESKIRFSAFKSRTTPLFTGKVTFLSPDIIMPAPGQQVNPADPTSAGFYLAQIELNMEEFEEIAETRALILHPGMQAEVQIVTGTRTMLRYLLDPIFDAIFKGFKEK